MVSNFIKVKCLLNTRMNVISSNNLEFDKLKLSKIFVYNNSNLCNIYYNNDLFYIHTPTLYIPYGMLYFQNSKTPMLEMTTENEKFDKGITKFKEVIKRMEDMCLTLYKELYKIQTGEILDKELQISSLVKNIYMKNSNKFLIPVSKEHCKCILLEYPSNRKTIVDNWNMVVPTYGVSIMRIKNFWVRENKCGINWILHSVQIMPSHLLDWQFTSNPTNENTITELLPSNALLENTTILNPIEHNPEYEVYFKMKKMGIPIEAIKNKMRINGHNPEILEYNGKLTIQIAQQQITTKGHTKILSSDKSKTFNIPTPPPLSSILFSNTNLTQEDINNYKQNDLKLNSNKINITGLLSQINSQEFKLKKTVIEEKKKVYSSTNLKVPKLEDIQISLSQLKKTDKKHLK